MSILALRSVVSSSLLYARSPKVSKDINPQLSTRSVFPHWLPFTLSHHILLLLYHIVQHTLCQHGMVAQEQTKQATAYNQALVCAFGSGSTGDTTLASWQAELFTETSGIRIPSAHPLNKRLEVFGLGSQTTLSQSVCTAKA